MGIFGVEDIFNLVGYGIRKRQPAIEGRIPTTDDLIRELETDRSEYEEIGIESPDGYNETEKVEQGPSVSSQSIREDVTQGTACIPCSNDHLSTCSGLLAEALRFARQDGVDSPEVISRVGLCRDELNAMERVDLRPELTSQLPGWEKEIATDALNGSRGLRHDMAGMLTVDDLETIAGKAQRLRGQVGEQWLRGRIANMSSGEKEKLSPRARDILEDLER